LKKLLRIYLPLVLIAGVIIALDQWTKCWVRAFLPPGGTWMPWDWLDPYARLVHWYNTGVAFGMFQGMNEIFALIGLVIIIAILFYYRHVPLQDWPLRFALGMQMGGAIGNLIDRVTLGHVIDFISIGTFAVFNIADASITVGVGVLILGLWMDEQQKKKKQSEAMVQDDFERTS
jgi:signal peptidase II